MWPPRRDSLQIEAAQRFAVMAGHGAEFDIEIEIDVCFGLFLSGAPASDDLTKLRPS